MEPTKDQLSISKTISAYISIENASEGKFKAICPFHDDTNPSLSIVEHGDDGAGYFNCFSCGAKGDVFEFVKRIEKTDFIVAKRKTLSICGFAVGHITNNDSDSDNDFEFLSTLRADTIKTLQKKINKFEKISWKNEVRLFMEEKKLTIFYYHDEIWQFEKYKWSKLEKYQIESLFINFFCNRYSEEFVTSSKLNEMFRFFYALAIRLEKNNSYVFRSLHPENDSIKLLTKDSLVTVSITEEISVEKINIKDLFFSTQRWNVSVLNKSSNSAPIFMGFLDKIQPDDNNKILLMELMGYMLCPDNRAQKFFILTGSGSNGKSVFLNILKYMIGEGGYTSLSLDQMEKDFVLADTNGKVANICADMGELDKAGEGNLKSYTSGDDITCNRKYLSTITFKPTAKLIFSTNNTPRFSDKTEGIWRRMIIIPFDTIIRSEEQDPFLFEKMKSEIDAIFSLALEGLKRLIKNNWEFTISDNIKKTLMVVRNDNSTLRQFLNDCCQLSPEHETTVSHLYNNYTEYTRKIGQKPSSKNSISRELNLMGIGSKVTRHNEKIIRRYCGITVSRENNYENN